MFEIHSSSILYVVCLQIISCLIDPLLQMCSMSASHLNASDMAAYMINCIHQIQSTLAVYEFTDKHIEMLAAQVKKWRTLVEIYGGEKVVPLKVVTSSRFLILHG